MELHETRKNDIDSAPKVEVGDFYLYGKTILRTDKCWNCKYHGRYGIHDRKYRGEITRCEKLFCQKTKRWGEPTRAYICQHFEDAAQSNLKGKEQTDIPNPYVIEPVGIDDRPFFPEMTEEQFEEMVREIQAELINESVEEY